MNPYYFLQFQLVHTSFIFLQIDSLNLILDFFIFFQNEVHRLLSALNGCDSTQIFGKDKNFACNESISDFRDLSQPDVPFFSNECLPDTSFST